MDWAKVEKQLREDAARLQKEQLKVPASAVASNAALGAAALVLTFLADAIENGNAP